MPNVPAGLAVTSSHGAGKVDCNQSRTKVVRENTPASWRSVGMTHVRVTLDTMRALGLMAVPSTWSTGLLSAGARAWGGTGGMVEAVGGAGGMPCGVWTKE